MPRLLPHVMTLMVVASGISLWWQATLGLQAFTWERYRRLQIERQPVRLVDITLQDHHGRLLQSASLRGQVLVINFIYTRCPTICGVTGLHLARLQAALAQRGYADKVHLLSISLDPVYDNPARLRDYLRRFSKQLSSNWQVVRPAKPPAGQQLLRQLGVVSLPDGLGGITHNAATHIVDQHGDVVKIMDENNLAQILATIEALLSPGRRS